MARSNILPRCLGGSGWAATYGLSTPRASHRPPPCIWTFLSPAGLSSLGKREFFSILLRAVPSPRSQASDIRTKGRPAHPGRPFLAASRPRAGKSSLLSRSPVDQFSYRLRDLAPMAHRKDPDDPVTSVDGVHDAESPDAILPQTLQVPQEGLAQRRIATERTKRSLDTAFDLRR